MHKSLKKKKFCQDFVPHSCHTWRKWRKVTAGCNFYHHLLMLWNCLRATVTYAKLCLRCTLVPPLNSAQKWHFPAETKTFQFVKKTNNKTPTYNHASFKSTKADRQFSKKEHFLFPEMATTHFPRGLGSQRHELRWVSSSAARVSGKL